MPKIWRIAGLSALLVLLLAMGGCSSDENNNQNPPTTGTLTGQIIFHGAWPDSGTVQLSIFDSWDVTLANCAWCPDAANGPPDYYTPALHDPNPANGDGPDTVTFAITGITLGTYQAVAAGWRAPVIHDIHCDEPVIGLYGAEPSSPDSLPEAVVFTSDAPEVTVTMNAYFDLPSSSVCDTTGTIAGVIHVNPPWPPEGLLAMITTFPFSPWEFPTGAPSAYYPLLTPDDTTFAFTPPLGTYYVSLWLNAAPPAPPVWFGSYGINTAADDAHSDAVTINTLNPDASGILITGQSPPPRFISGHVTFNGTRPDAGILLLLSTFPYSPEHAPQGPPSDYFIITNPNETLYAFSGLPNGTYYVSLWSNTPPPGVPTFFGAYGYVAGSDTDPDPIVIADPSPGYVNIDVVGGP